MEIDVMSQSSPKKGSWWLVVGGVFSGLVLAGFLGALLSIIYGGLYPSASDDPLGFGMALRLMSWVAKFGIIGGLFGGIWGYRNRSDGGFTKKLYKIMLVSTTLLVIGTILFALL